MIVSLKLCHAEFLQYLTERGGSLPNKDDLFGSAMALLRLQDVYALPTSKMAHGLINEASQSATMTGKTT